MNLNTSNLIDELSTSVGQGIFSSKKSAINHEEMPYGPENKRECPCDTCPMMNSCLEDQTECSAMRNWCSRAAYKDPALIRLERPCE